MKENDKMGRKFSGAQSFSVESGRLLLYGRELLLPASLKEMERLLGPHTRRAGVVDEVYLWDELGLYAHREAGGERIESVIFILKRGVTPFEPKQLFRAHLTLEQAPINAETPLWKILSSAKGPPIKKLHQNNLYGYELPSRLVELTLDGEHVARLSVSALRAP